MAASETGDFDERDYDEIDHELDADLEEVPGGDQAPAAHGGSPSVIVDDVHVRYRVFGGRLRSAETSSGGLRRLFDRGRKHVGSVSEVHAVRGVSFVAHQGESIGLIGLNGAGKSTLLRAIAGLMPVSSGAIYVDGRSALLGVNAALIRSLSGERNIMIGGLALGLDQAQVKERFDDIVEFAGVEDFINLPMKAYSSGMAARLRFAISTAAVPDILLIDEALATGDARFRARSHERIEQIREQAGTVFLVSHSARSIERMCDRAIWIDQGQMVDDGPVSEVLPRFRAEMRRRR